MKNSIIKLNMNYFVMNREWNDMGTFNSHPTRTMKRIFCEQAFRTVAHQHLSNNILVASKVNSGRNIQALLELNVSFESWLYLVSPGYF